MSRPMITATATARIFFRSVDSGVSGAVAAPVQTIGLLGQTAPTCSPLSNPGDV